MNKTFIAILLSVCFLGMALAMFSERLSRESGRSPSSQLAASNAQLPDLAASNGVASTPVNVPNAPAAAPVTPEAQIEEHKAEVLEGELAKTALAPPPAITVKPEAEIQAVLPQGKEDKPAADAIKPAPIPAPVREEKPKPEIKPVPVQSADKTPAAERPQQAVKTAASGVASVPDTQRSTQTAVRQPEQTKPAVAQQKASNPANSITNFVVFARDKGATVRLGGNNKIRYNSMTLENPDRVVVDLDGDWQFPANLPVPKNEMVNSVRVGKMGEKTRVVIDLKVKPRQSRMVEGQNGNNLDIRVDK